MDEWISVDEKKPKLEDRVIAYADKEMFTADYSNLTGTGPAFYEVWSGIRMDNVTHWRPMLEPPSARA
ncbi:MAG: DUF551 domain-containing protein [Deltaproteobacteria bacterium]|nr:DUF551 domain-containing protein [Deltaproteobacteria bacterium]